MLFMDWSQWQWYIRCRIKNMTFTDQLLSWLFIMWYNMLNAATFLLILQPLWEDWAASSGLHLSQQLPQSCVTVVTLSCVYWDAESTCELYGPRSQLKLVYLEGLTCWCRVAAQRQNLKQVKPLSAPAGVCKQTGRQMCGNVDSLCFMFCRETLKQLLVSLFTNTTSGNIKKVALS